MDWCMRKQKCSNKYKIKSTVVVNLTCQFGCFWNYLGYIHTSDCGYEGFPEKVEPGRENPPGTWLASFSPVTRIFSLKLCIIFLKCLTIGSEYHSILFLKYNCLLIILLNLCQYLIFAKHNWAYGTFHCDVKMYIIPYLLEMRLITAGSVPSTSTR